MLVRFQELRRLLGKTFNSIRADGNVLDEIQNVVKGDNFWIVFKEVHLYFKKIRQTGLKLGIKRL